MDTLKIRISRAENKRMSSVNPYAFSLSIGIIEFIP
mgnify:CR=1 FL=1